MPKATRCTLSILSVAAVGMTTLLALLSDAGHDQLWLLLAAERMGSGADPYGRTVFESNPPLVIWLSWIPMAAAHALGLPLTATFKLFIVLVAVGSASASALLVRRLYPALSPARWWILTLAFIFIFGAVPMRDFGERDHVLTLLILPYLLAAAVWAKEAYHAPDTGVEVAVRSLSPAQRAALVACAAIGICLKPHQVLLPLAVELAVVLLCGLRRGRVLEPTILLSAAGLYLAAIRLFAPNYLTEVVPVLRDTYWAFGHLTLPELLLASPGLQTLLLGSLLVALYHRRTRFPAHLMIPSTGHPRQHPLSAESSRKIPGASLAPLPADATTAILLSAAVAADLAFMAQGTGWYYQQLPAFSLTLLALTVQLLPSRLRLPAFIPVLLGTATLLAFALTVNFSGFEFTHRGLEQAQPTPDPSFFANLPAGTAVATLTTSVDDTVPPAFRYQLKLAQRYPHLWMLPAILRNESGPAPRHRVSPARLAELDRLQHRFMVEDLRRWHPALLLVARCQDPAVHCQVLEDRHDNLLAWFLRDPVFADLFAHYHFVRSSGPYDAYALQ